MEKVNKFFGSFKKLEGNFGRGVLEPGWKIRKKLKLEKGKSREKFQ